MSREVASVVFVVAVILALGVGGVLGTGYVGAQNETQVVDTDDQTITVTGQASAEAPPDQAVVSVVVVTDGDDPTAVRDDLADGTDALLRSLSNVSVTDDRIETTDFQIRETYRDPFVDPEPETPVYRGVHTFQVTVDDVDRAGTVIDATADAGAQVQWVSFSLSEERRVELRDEALVGAMDDAHQQADTLAAAGGLEIVGVQHIDARDGRFGSFVAEEMFEEADAEGTVLVPGDVRVSVTVQVTYDATAG